MRKLKILIISLGCLCSLSACEEKSVITMEQLPAAAQEYVKENYADVNVTYVKKEKEMFSTKYEVRLDNGVEIEFDAEGVPVDVDVDD